MKLTSSVFQHEGFIPRKYTCDGPNINPPLTISDVPSHAKSLVIIMEDPDVPTYLREDGMWDHWIVFNIPANTTEIEEGKAPLGTLGKGTGGNLNYYGPCPPNGEHRYFIKLFALDTLLTISEGVSKQQVMDAMKNHILEQTELMGMYGRT